MRKKKIGCILAVILILAAVFILRERAVWKEKSVFALDTYCTLQIKGKDFVLDEMTQCIRNADKKLNAYDTQSALYALNQSGYSRDAEIVALTERLLEYHAKTGGAFDFALKKASDLWGFTGENPRVPNRIDLESIGADKVQICDNAVCLQGVEVDFGAVAKGYVTNELVRILERENVQEAILDLGGNIYAKGQHMIGIKNPQAGESLACSISVRDRAVITSGVYQRCFTDENGKTWHHILDPESGWPVQNEVLSVTVIGEDAMECDVLSTAFLVMGREKAFLEYKRFGVELIVITADSIYCSPGIEEKTELKDAQYALKTDSA